MAAIMWHESKTPCDLVKSIDDDFYSMRGSEFSSIYEQQNKNLLPMFTSPLHKWYFYQEKQLRVIYKRM